MIASTRTLLARIRRRSPRYQDAPAEQPQARDMPVSGTASARDPERFLIAGVQMRVPIGGGNVAAMVAEVEKAMALFPAST